MKLVKDSKVAIGFIGGLTAIGVGFALFGRACGRACGNIMVKSANKVLEDNELNVQKINELYQTVVENKEV